MSIEDAASRRQHVFPPESLRAELLALGIPAGHHTAGSLSAYFPREFNIGSAGLDAEGLGEVIVYLAKRGILGLPAAKTASVLRKVQPGWHFCQFYQNFTQYLRLLPPYVADGLRSGQACLWVIPPQVPVETALGAIAEAAGDVAPYLSSGQLEVLPHRLWYFDGAGRFKSFEEIAAALIGRQEQALAKGFTFLRAAGDAGWVSGTEQSKSFIDYEMKVNAAIGQTKVAALCTFHAALTAPELESVIAAHQDSLELLRA